MVVALLFVGRILPSQMARASIFIFFVLSRLLLSFSYDRELKYRPDCPPFPCGKLSTLSFPFNNSSRPKFCGSFIIDGCSEAVQKIKFDSEGKWYEVTSISQGNTISIRDQELRHHLQSRSCQTFNNLSLPRSPLFTLTIIPNITLFKCNRSNTHISLPTEFSYRNCSDYVIFYNNSSRIVPPVLPPQCSIIHLPVKRHPYSKDPFSFLFHEFLLQARWSSFCVDCYFNGGRCALNSNRRAKCVGVELGKENLVLKLTAGICGGSTILLIFLLVFCRYMRRKYATSNFLSGNTCSDSSPKSGLEGGNLYFGVPVFSYHELEEATNNFDSSKELGDGGFGTVYHGKLQDGREVAVKRLYEKSYKRIEQFINEIRILTRLRHQNLVSLYGCTSCHSRELLLVYEFITNGTVADHLHGDLANHRLLTWPIRLNIAIETASALAYLHASEIIHRDVKTNNILLDSNFSVKVADFGLSRLFPADITHVSTAPQGTPGYVDPEYHQCYQLTKKSDVYSFGVVLIELISSMPAVDISRHQNEINLANLALNRIQNKELDELIDPCLGFETDLAVRRMTISVAELAFQCLQVERDARPLMEDVLMALRNIESGDHDLEKPEEAVDTVGPSISVLPPPSPESDDVVGLLKNMRPPPSPDSVTNKWVSGPTTPSTSC